MGLYGRHSAQGRKPGSQQCAMDTGHQQGISLKAPKQQHQARNRQLGMQAQFRAADEPLTH